MKTVIHCQDCDKDVTDSIQIYPKPGEVLCEECNWDRGNHV